MTSTSDGKQDVAVTLSGTNQLAVLLGNGDGTLQNETLFALPGRQPDGLVLADWNRDGRLDVALAMAHYDSVETLLNTGSW